MASSEAPQQPAEKICVYCGLDCSDRPRVKNEKGQYACRSCMPKQPAPTNVAAASAADDALQLEDAPPEPPAETCPMCHRRKLPDHEQCVHCGFSPRHGLQKSNVPGASTTSSSALTCRQCGYDMTGLPSPRCPECGTVTRMQSRRALHDAIASDVLRETYLTPLLMLVIGASVTSVILLMNEGATEVLYYLASYLISVPVGVGVFLACCVIWIGFDAPIHLTALRLAGIYAVVDAASEVLGFLPLGLLSYIFLLLLYMALLSQLLEIEIVDAFLVAVLTGATRLAIGAVLYGMLVA